MSFGRDDDGLAVLYATLLIPTFLILVCFAVEVGVLRVTRARMLAAADLAVTSAVNEQDRSALAADGRYRLAPGARDVARALLAAELAPLASRLSDTTPEAVAASARIEQPDPVTLRISFDAPVRTPLLAVAALREATVLRITAAAGAK